METLYGIRINHILKNWDKVIICAYIHN